MTPSLPRKSVLEQSPPIKSLYSLSLREGNSKKPIYEMHKWWARRLGINFRFLLVASMTHASMSEKVISSLYRRQCRPDLVVCDPFMGGGTSIVEASKMGMRTIGVDIDPVAWFITRKELESFDQRRFSAAVSTIEARVRGRIRQYYMTRLDDGRQVDVVYYFWVDYPRCPSCRRRFEAHPTFELARNEKKKSRVVFCRECHSIRTLPLAQRKFRCSNCGSMTTLSKPPIVHGRYHCPNCDSEGNLRNLARPGRPIDKKLFAVEYWDPIKKTRDYSPARTYDLRLYRAASEEYRLLGAQLRFPQEAIPMKGRSDRRPIIFGYSRYSDLFNSRQLLCLSLIYQAILDVKDDKVREYLLLAFSDSLASNNMLCAYAFGYRKLTPLFGLHSYRHVSRPVEGNVWGTIEGRGTFRRCLEKVIKGKDYCANPFEFRYSHDGEPIRVFTGEKIECRITDSYDMWEAGKSNCLLVNRSSEDLGFIPDGSVDIVLTDPPYFNNISYSELSDFYWVWLKEGIANHAKHRRGQSSLHKKALYVSRLTESQVDRYADGLSRVFSECKRILKSDGRLIFTYHHNDRRAWESLATSLLVSGYRVVNVFPMLSEGRSGFHSSGGNIKWDCVLVCRKKEVYEGPRLDSTQCVKRAMSHADMWARRLARLRPTRFNGVDRSSLLCASLVAELTRHNATVDDVSPVFSLLQSNLHDLGSSRRGTHS